MLVTFSPSVPTAGRADAPPHPFQVRLEKRGERPAFHALPEGALGSQIRATSKLRVQFANGSAIGFDAECGVALHSPEKWQGKDSIVIIVDKVWFTAEHRLTAVRQADAESKGIMHIALGGFRLDPTGAILADSFWDIAELSPVAEPELVEPNIHPVAAQMRDIILAKSAEAEPTTEDDLAHYTLADIKAHFPAAREAANKIVVRQLDDGRGFESRAQLLSRATTALLRSLPEHAAIFGCLRRQGLSESEILDIWPDVIPAAAMAFQRLHAKAH